MFLACCACRRRAGACHTHPTGHTRRLAQHGALEWSVAASVLRNAALPGRQAVWLSIGCGTCKRYQRHDALANADNVIDPALLLCLCVCACPCHVCCTMRNDDIEGLRKEADGRILPPEKNGKFYHSYSFCSLALHLLPRLHGSRLPQTPSVCRTRCSTKRPVAQVVLLCAEQKRPRTIPAHRAAPDASCDP